MKTLLGALLCALCLASPAHAGKRANHANIDFGRITCGEFLEDVVRISDDDAAAVLLWIDGYLSGVSGDTTLNWATLEDYTEDLVDFCVDHPRRKLLDAAREVGIR